MKPHEMYLGKMVNESYCIRKPELGTRQLFYLRDNNKRDNVSGGFCELQQCDNFFTANKATIDNFLSL